MSKQYMKKHEGDHMVLEDGDYEKDEVLIEYLMYQSARCQSAQSSSGKLK